MTLPEDWTPLTRVPKRRTQAVRRHSVSRQSGTPRPSSMLSALCNTWLLWDTVGLVREAVGEGVVAMWGRVWRRGGRWWCGGVALHTHCGGYVVGDEIWGQSVGKSVGFS